MQYNVYYIEVLGEEKLKGLAIPVVVDTRAKLTDSEMSAIAKTLNTYRTVFVRKNIGNTLITRIFSAHGETQDCLYASVATLYTLTESYYIREIEKGEKKITIETNQCKSNVSISYDKMQALGMVHELKFGEFIVKSEDNRGTYNIGTVASKEDNKKQLDIVTTEDSIVFSKIRKGKIKLPKMSKDYILAYYSPDIDTIFFHVNRVFNPDFEKLDSKAHITFLTEYMLEKGILDKKDLKICHVLNTGQYALMNVKILKDKMLVKMKARNLLEGILNI